MTTPVAALNAANTPPAQTAGNELFALTDEQILDIQPDKADGAPVGEPIQPAQKNTLENPSSLAEHTTRDTEHEVSAEPPAWLARQMNDPWSGEEARELWSGVQTARQEAAAFREVFAKPEEARSAAERSRALEEIDAAFFGGAGKSAQEISAGRAALADRMLREDPAAFREMVFAGLRALEAAGQNATTAAPAASTVATQEHVAAVFGPREVSTQHSAQSAAAKISPSKEGGYMDAEVVAYRNFEKSANDQLERSVGGAIQRSLEQALPNLSWMDQSSSGQAAPLHARLQQAVRDNVEAALKSDQQLGEQLGRVLAARRFDETTRSQVVRLINDRAQQLVPVAARRVIQEWTQTAFAARSDSGVTTLTAAGATSNANTASPRSLASSFGPSTRTGQAAAADSSRSANRTSAPATSAKAAAANRAERDAGLSPRATARPNGRAVDYNRLSDEQILEL